MTNEIVAVVDGGLLLDDGRRGGRQEECPACGGDGRVCCATWGAVRARAGEDLAFSGVGLPLWPLAPELEMAYCPFCGVSFRPR